MIISKINNEFNSFFSIIIPTFNRKDIIKKCIDSVIDQSFKNFEIIVVDNGSTDKTKKWMSNEYRDNRLKYYFQKGSGSPASPRNRGILMSKGNWVLFS